MLVIFVKATLNGAVNVNNTDDLVPINKGLDKALS